MSASADGRVVQEASPGYGNMLFGYVLLGLAPLPVAWLARHGFGAASTVFARFAFAAVCILGTCLVRRRGLSSGNPKLLVLRGVFGGAAVLLYFFSIQHAGAARGTILNYTYPIWANVLSLFLGERPQPRFWFMLALAIVGVGLIVAPAEGWGRRPLGAGELAGLVSAVCAGAAVLTIKRLRATDESLTIISGFTFFGLLFATPLVHWNSAFSALSEPSVAVAACLVGLLSFGGHVLFTRGYKGVSLAHGTLLSLLVPTVATFGGIVALHEPLSLRFALGVALVLIALGAPLLKRP